MAERSARAQLTDKTAPPRTGAATGASKPMSDFATVVLAVAAAAGAWAARPLPLVAAAAVAGAGVALRRPLVLCLGAALLTSTLAARSWAGLHPPGQGRWSGRTTLVDDPERVTGALRVIVRVGGKRVEAWARGPSARALDDRLAGERVWLEGHVQALSPEVRARLAPRHVGARFAVERVGGWAPGPTASRLANGIRRTLLAGAASLPPDRRALFAGFVLGDDRDEPADVADDFKASGLTHLLVVSGENVAFVLGLFGPLLRRMGLRGRLVVGLVVLALFGVVTRWEPSVLRAEAMAALVLVAAAAGRPASTLRLLALGVTGLLLVDPLLVRSVGFVLSVGACAGIAVLGRPLARALPGPRPLASALGVTLAAQAAVAPVLVTVFGGVPLATVPANLLAVPAAGPLTAWGMSGGLAAGLVGGTAARVVHLPTSLLLAWVATVARHAAAAPLGRLQGAHLGALAATAAVAAALRRRSLLVGGCAAVAAVAVVPALSAGAVSGQEVSPGARLWRHSGATVLVVDGARSAPALLGALRAKSVRRLDVVVVTRPGPAAAALVAPVVRRFPPRLLLAPTGSPVPGATVAHEGATVAVGPIEVSVEADHPRLVVRVSGPGGSPPPAPTPPPPG